MRSHLATISVLAALALALSATGLVRAFHLETAHGVDSGCVVDVCDSGTGAESSTPAPAPSPSEDEDCPECHLLASTARAVVVWTVATIVLDAPDAAFVAIEQQRAPEDAHERSHPARGPPALA